MTIDWWTLGLQTINVAILIWLLARFFWRPVAAMIDKRREVAKKLLADADASRAEAAAARAEIDRTRAGFAAERDAVLAAAKLAAEKLRADQLEQAAREADALRARAQAEIDRHKLDAQRAWTEQASRLAIDIAQRLAGRLGGAAVHQAFRGWLLAALAALPEAKRQEMTAKGQTLLITSATPLAADERSGLTEALAGTLGGPPAVSFATDPALIAGLELRCADLIIANSWRADLNHILADISNAKPT